MSRRLGRIAIVDVTWGLLFVAIGWVAFLADEEAGGRCCSPSLVTLWGGRLAWHIRRRVGAGEDPRYEKMLAQVPEGERFAFAVRKVFLVQGLAAWFVSLPPDGGRCHRPSAGVAGRRRGVVLWVVGMAFETVGDAQLAAYVEDPATSGHGDQQRAVGVHATPQLLRRRLRVVGHWLVGGLASELGGRRCSPCCRRS